MTEIDQRNYKLHAAISFAPLFHPLKRSLFIETTDFITRNRIDKLMLSDRGISQANRERMMEVTFERLGLYSTSDHTPSHQEIAKGLGPQDEDGRILSREMVRQIEQQGRERIELSVAAAEIYAASQYAA